MWLDKYQDGNEIELEEQLAKLEKRYRWVHPYTLLRFDVHVTEHCNLKCKTCNHCSPVAEEEYLDLAEYKRDCARLSELFASEIKFANLIGGEPLLHPKLTEIMRITREAFQVGKVRIITNGLLLPSMGDDFWKACRDYRITLSPTEYPVNFDYDKWQKYAEDHGVTWSSFKFYNMDSESDVKLMQRKLIGTTGRHIVEQNYYHCLHANNCLQLCHGRLYTCQYAAYAHHLKKYFNLDIHLSERNGVDIYEVKDAYELMTKVNRPIPFCQYCNVDSLGYEESWGISCKDRYEWIEFEWTQDDIRYLKDATSVYVYGADEMGVKTVNRLKKNNIVINAVLVEDTDKNPVPVLDVPVIRVQDVKPEGEHSVCMLAVDNAEKTKAGRAVNQCGFRQIIPLYVC